jgi:hypothetical protein
MGKPPDEFAVHTTGALDHERSDAQIRPLALFLAGLVGSVVFVGLVVWLLFDVLFATVNTPATGLHMAPTLTNRDAGQPPLQVVPLHDMQALRAREDRILSATEWIDREKGLARIPIAAAMEQIATGGLPKWPPIIEQPPAPPTSASSPTNQQPQNSPNQTPK